MVDAGDEIKTRVQKPKDHALPTSEIEQQFRNSQLGAQHLSEITVFKGFNKEELELLYSRGEILSYRPGSYVVIEGEPSRGLYVILYGTVSVYKNDPATGSMARLAFLEVGNNFGEFSLFDTAPRSASVAAESVCVMFYLDVEVFMQVLAEKGVDMQLRFYKTCAEELVGRFRKLNADYIAAQQLLWKYALSPHSNQNTDEHADKQKKAS